MQASRNHRMLESCLVSEMERWTLLSHLFPASVFMLVWSVFFLFVFVFGGFVCVYVCIFVFKIFLFCLIFFSITLNKPKNSVLKSVFLMNNSYSPCDELIHWVIFTFSVIFLLRNCILPCLLKILHINQGIKKKVFLIRCHL